MKKRVHLFLTSILSWSLLTPWAGALRAAEKGPNVLLIMTDDLGYGDLGCYGQKQIQTPELDRMAGEGLRFTQFYAGSTVCAPSGGRADGGSSIKLGKPKTLPGHSI